MRKMHITTADAMFLSDIMDIPPLEHGHRCEYAGMTLAFVALE
jgi:hypothetical protein